MNGKALSKELRSLIIDKIIRKEGNTLTGQFNSSYSAIARSVGVSHVTVAKVWKQFCSTRSLSPKKNSIARPSHLSYGDLCLIEALKREKPTISYDEILEQLYEFGDLPFGTVSKSTLSKAVRGRHPGGEFTLKKLGRIAQERFTVRNMAYTQLFLDYLYQKDPYKINFFDECDLKLPSASNRNYGHALRGERAVEFSRYLETANVTVNLMASMQAGVCYANTVDGPADTVDFLNFFEEAYNSIDPITNEPCLKAEDIIVMDNAPTHHNAGGQILSEFLQELGIELVYIYAGLFTRLQSS